MITGAQNVDLSVAQMLVGSATTIALTSIDGSAATGKLSITDAGTAVNALTIKGGSAADTITVSSKGATITGGVGADNFVVTAAVAGSTTAPIVTTITDAASSDKITFVDKGTEVFNTVKVNVSAATDLLSALNLVTTGNGGTNGIISYFQFGGDIYVVEDNGAGSTLDEADVVVKLTGTYDLSTATGAGTHIITLA